MELRVTVSTRNATQSRRELILPLSAVLVAAAASCGCGEPAQTADGQAPFGRIEAEPFVMLDGPLIGGPGSYGMSGVHRLLDGSTVVADATQQLHWFDSAGRSVDRAPGYRAFAGPGSDLSWMSGYRGDSLVVYDAAAGLMSVLDSSGSVARRFRFGTESLVGLIEPHSPFPDGSLLAMMLPVYVQQRSQGWWAVVHLVTFGPEGERREHLGPALLHPCGSDVQRCAAEFKSYSGSWMAGETGVYVARPDRAQIGFITADSAAVMAGPQGWGGEPAEGVPTYSRLLLDSEGLLWAQSGDGSRAAVFDPKGGLLGTVEVPQELRIYQVGSDFVVGVVGNDGRNEQVQIHKLYRDASAPPG